MNVPTVPVLEAASDKLPVPVLRAANLARQAVWQIVGADLQGAGLLAQDSDTGDVLIIGQSYGPKNAWYMPGGGIHETPETTAYDEFQQEIRPSDDVKFSALTHLTNSVHEKGRVKDTFGVFHAVATGLSGYIESIRERPIAVRRQMMSNELARLWMVPPDWLAEQTDLDLHHGLRAGINLITK